MGRLVGGELIGCVGILSLGRAVGLGFGHEVDSSAGSLGWFMVGTRIAGSTDKGTTTGPGRGEGCWVGRGEGCKVGSGNGTGMAGVGFGNGTGVGFVKGVGVCWGTVTGGACSFDAALSRRLGRGEGGCVGTGIALVVVTWDSRFAMLVADWCEYGGRE